MLYDHRGMKIIRPEMINRENMSATEVRLRIAKDHDWQELLLNSTINLIESFNGVERIKKLYEMIGNKSCT
jgi:nicotinamide mononucleotide adenylyltransferase